jgi:hypothetical protein
VTRTCPEEVDIAVTTALRTGLEARFDRRELGDGSGDALPANVLAAEELQHDVRQAGQSPLASCATSARIAGRSTRAALAPDRHARWSGGLAVADGDSATWSACSRRSPVAGCPDMSAWTATLLSVTTVSLASLAGLASLSLDERRLRRLSTLLVSFAVGTLLGDTFIHILPDIFSDRTRPVGTSLAVLGGILLFFVIEKLLRHGHGRSRIRPPTRRSCPSSQ